jgi:hypothetical protein
MKKVLVLLLSVIFLSSCKKEPISDYSVGNIITPEDWKGIEVNDTISSVKTEKTILVKNILTSHLYSSDSIKVEVKVGDLKNFKNMPNSKVLDMAIYRFLLDCKYECKNTATFKPYELSIVYISDVLPHEPTKKEYDDFEESYGFYKKYPNYKSYYSKLKMDMIEKAKKGTPNHIMLYLKFLASNAYGTPGELTGYGTIENGEYKFNLAG